MSRLSEVAVVCLLVTIFACVSIGCSSEPFTVIVMPDTQAFILEYKMSGW